MVMEKEGSVSITIYGKEYKLTLGNKDSSGISELEKYVNEKMKEISNTTHVFGTIDLTMITLLNVVDELLQLKKNNKTSRENMQKKTKDLINIFDDTLEDKEGGNP